MKKITIFLFIAILSGCKSKDYKFATIDPKCGPRALQFICENHEINSSLEEICVLSGYNEKSGTNLYGLFKAAEKKGLIPDAVRCDITELCNHKYPSIVFVNGNHFSVFIGCSGDSVSLFDPPDSPSFISKNEFKKRWKGETLFVSPKKSEKKGGVTVSISSVGPKIEFEVQRHYLGTLELGVKVKHDFVYKNAGNDTLKIIGLRTRCSCLDPLPNDRIIPPGGSGKITLEYNSEGKNRGFDTQSASVMTNDRENKVLMLTLEATILSEVKVIPDKLFIGHLTPNQTVEKEILVKNSGSGKLRVNFVEAPDGINAEIKPAIKDTLGNMAIPIQLSINSGVSFGEYERNILIKTNNSQNPEFKIPVKGEIVSEFKVYPPKIVFGKIKTNSVIVKELIIISKPDQKLENSKVSSPRLITCELKEMEDFSYKLTATFHAGNNAKIINEKIKIYADNREKPVLEIPVYAKIVN